MTQFIIFQSVIRALPVVSKLKDSLQKTCLEILKTLLIYLIPIAPELCKEILAKNFSDSVLQELSTLSEQSPEALHLAICIAFHSGIPEAVIYVIPFLLLNLARDQKFRTSSLISIEQFLQKTLPAIQVQFDVKVDSELCQFIDKMPKIKKILKKILNFKTGISQDENFVTHALSKIDLSAVEGFLALAISIVTYEKTKYIKALSKIKSDSLTDLIVSMISSVEEQAECLQRFEFYKDWAGFPHCDFLTICLRTEELLEQTLKILNAQRFLDLKSIQYEVFMILISYLPRHSLIIHEKLEVFEIPAALLIQAIDSKQSLKQYEAILQVVQYSSQHPKILAALFNKLFQLNKESNIHNEYLKELLLVTIRIQGAGVLVSNKELEEIMDSVNKDSGIELKKNALMALCCFDEKNKDSVISVIENSAGKVSSNEEYFFFKSILEKFKTYDIAGIVKILIFYVQKANLGILEANKIIKLAGSQYLHLLIFCYLNTDFETLFGICMDYPVLDVLKAFENLLILRSGVSLIEYFFAQKKFIEKFSALRKPVSEGLSKIFFLIFEYSSETQNKTLEKNEKKGLVSASKNLKSLLSTLNSSLDDPLLSSAFSILLQNSTFYSSSEALEFLLPHVESAPNYYYSLINPLCTILENHISKAKNLHSEKYSKFAIFVQLVLSLLYVLLRNYKDTSKILVVYGNCVLGYTKATKAEVQSAACLCFSTFFAEKNLETLPFLETFIEQVLVLCNNPENAIQSCGISCLSTLIAAAEEFLSPFVDKIIDTACKLGNTHLFKLLSNHIPHRTLFENLSKSLFRLQDSEKLLENLFGLCGFIGEKATALDLSALKDKVFEFYKQAFAVVVLKKPKDIERISDKIGKSFAAMALSLTNSQLKPFVLETFH